MNKRKQISSIELLQIFVPLDGFFPLETQENGYMENPTLKNKTKNFATSIPLENKQMKLLMEKFYFLGCNAQYDFFSGNVHRPGIARIMHLTKTVKLKAYYNVFFFFQRVASFISLIER